MKRLSGSALAILGGGFSNVCFILMHVFHMFKRKHISQKSRIWQLLSNHKSCKSNP